MPDGRPVTIYLEGATHELVLFALDPRGNREKLINSSILGKDTCQILHPANFGAQFISDNDATARGRIEDTVKLIVEGKLSPDTDFTSQWVALWGDNMLKRRP